MKTFRITKLKCPRCGGNATRAKWLTRFNVFRIPMGLLVAAVLGRSVLHVGFICCQCGEGFLAPPHREREKKRSR